MFYPFRLPISHFKTMTVAGATGCPVILPVIALAFPFILFSLGCAGVDDADDERTPSGICGGACAASQYDDCTCDPLDPCGWSGDGFCDVTYCSEFASTSFDDGGDCPTLPPCDGACGLGTYNECTCAPSDPCGWSGEGFCDVIYCAQVTSNYFDDEGDCGTSAICDGSCGTGTYNSCTCGSSDPCGWSADNYCDEASCAIVLPEGYFDDSTDCQGAAGVCDGDCTSLRYTQCTCGTSDPCGWAANDRCDATGCNQVSPGSTFDDTADCGSEEPTTDDTYAVTAVRDDLDNSDMDIMYEGLQDLGYTSTVRDINVTSHSMENYLAQNHAFLYHTGHGYDGQVMTADGAIEVRDVTINVQTTVFATCLTLADSWSSAFGSTAETVLGYTNISYDIIDDDVAEDFLDYLDAGRRPIVAWYLANDRMYDLSDRWAGYVRESGRIVEYSARTGRIPSATADTFAENLDLVSLGRIGNLRVDAGLLASTRMFEPATLEVAIARDGAQTQGLMPNGWDLLGPTRMTRADAVEIAEEYAQSRLGGLEQDAVLDAVVEIVSRVEGQPEVTVGYRIGWYRQVSDLPVRSNGVADHVHVLVGPQGVVAWSQYWPQIEVVPASVDYSSQILPVGLAVSLAADSISRAAKGEVDLIDARPVFGTLGPRSRQTTLVPAYELEATDGSRIVIDAMTGRLLL